MKTYYTIFLFVFIALKGFTQYPGNVSSNLRSWHKANAGTTITGSGVSSWADQSGNSFTAVQGTNNRRPPLTTNVFNFNPALTFDGDDNHMTLGDVMVSGATGITVFAVANLTGTSEDDWGTIIQGQASAAWTGGGYGLGALNVGNTAFGFWVRDYSANVVSSSTSISVGSILTGVWNTSSSGTVQYKHNGASQGTDSYTAGSVGDNGSTTIGGAPTTNYNFYGNIAELIVYNTGLTTANIDKIESYLAMKYGITKAGDYVSSVGTSTVVWNSTTNSAYHNDVTVIGRDDNSVLDQRKSKSINSDNVIIIDKGGAFGADQTFLAWGNNNGSIASWSTTENPSDMGIKNIKRLTREWKVATTGTPGAVTVSIDNTNLPALPSSYHTYVLLVDADGNFASGATIYPMQLNSGSIYDATSTITLANGSFFTIGIVHNISKQTGNFGTVSTWAAGVAPITLEEAIVMNTHTVTLTANQTTGSVLVSTGGKLDLGTYKLNVDSATITNNGTFAASTGTVEYSAAFGQNVAALTYYGLSTSGAGTKTLVGNATVTGTLNINAAGSGTSSLTHSATINPSLTITGAVVINQPSSNATSSWNINAGSASVGGNLSFPGYSNNPNRIGQITITTGSLGITGSCSLSSNNQSPTNEVIQITSSGVLTFESDFTHADGTLSASGTATVNFNGTTTRSYDFGGANTPVLTTNSGSTLNFKKGLRAQTTNLTLHASSNSYFTGTGSIVATSTLKFGNLQIIAGGYTITGSNNFEVQGNWTNNTGTYTDVANTVTFSGASKTITGTSGTAFYNVAIATGASYTLGGGNTYSANNLTFNASATASSLTHSTTEVFNVSGTATINQPTNNGITTQWAINGGSSTVNAFTFSGTNTTATRIRRATVTTGTLTISGTVTFASHASSSSNEILEVTSSGLIAFGADLTQANGLLSAAGTSTLTFNGSTATSYIFGGANTPALTTNSGTTLNFAKGITCATTDLTLHAASTSIFTDHSTITPTSSLNFGNLQIASTKTVTAAGSYSVSGNWTNNGIYTPSTRTVHFAGTSAQSIGGSAATTFYGLTINNSSATGVTLSQPTTVSNALTLTDGYVYTDATNLLILNDGVTSSAGSATTFVDGPMRKIGNDAFVFPLGDDAGTDVWARLAISAPSNITDAFTAQYIFNNPDGSYSVSSLSSAFDNVSSKEYWLLDRSVGTSSVTIGLYWEDATAHGITDCPDLTIAHWTGSQWDEEPATASGTCSGSGTGVVTTTATVGSFSPFTFGSLVAGKNPLPIELVEFTAKLNTNAVDVSWSTATETNNDYFLVERSKDGLTFEPITKVKGAGTSTYYRQYKIMDDSPFTGISYYRLKQIDFDGKSSYSQIVSVDYSKKLFNVYPSPVKSGQKLYINPTDKSTTFIIYDLLGNSYVYKNLTLSDGVLAIETLNLAAGTYFLFTESSKNWFKLVVE